MMILLSPLIIMTLTGLSIMISLILFNNILMSFLIYYVGFAILLPLIDLFIIKKKTVKEYLAFLGFNFNKNILLAGLISGILIFTLILLITAFLHQIFFQENTIITSIEKWGISRENVIIVIIIMLIFNGAMEEIYWRGYIFRRLEKLKKSYLPVLLTALFFTAQHIIIIMSLVKNVFAIILFLFAIGVGGLLWGLIRKYYKSVVPCIISHMFATAGYMTIFYIYIL